LHLPFHLCIVLVGTGALDLIRLYKEEHHIIDNDTETGSLGVISGYSVPTLLKFDQPLAMGFQGSFERTSFSVASGSDGGGAERHTDYNLTKQYFLVVCSLVFLCNSLLKWINLRSYDKFQKIVYLSRFLNSIFILCLLAVPLNKMTPFALLGSMAGFCAVQVAVDLAVIYFGAYGFVNDLEAWAKSARSSIDLGSFLPSPLGGRSRGTSRATSLAGSVVDLNAALNGQQGGRHGNASAISLVSPTNTVLARAHPPSQQKTNSYFPQQAMQQQHQQQQQLSLQLQGPSLSQQQQQELYNMHVNANSLGSSGAYGNLVQALAEIKKRETPAAGRQMSLNAAERGLSTTTMGVPISRVRSNGSSNLTANVQRNAPRPGTGGGSHGHHHHQGVHRGSVGGRGGAMTTLGSMFSPPTPPPGQQSQLPR
jgi:hypothetical protein